MIAAILIPFVALSGKWVSPSSLSGKSLLFIVLSAIATGASWICYFRALQLGQVHQVAPVDKLSVVLVALLAYVFLGERPVAKDVLGVLLVASGVIILAVKR